MKKNKCEESVKERREILYIMAPSYTGSTLLTFLLAMHPKIATMGELKATAMGDIEKYRCSCGALLHRCNFWQEVKKQMRDLGAHFEFDNFGTHFRSKSYFCNFFLGASVRQPAFETLRSFGCNVVPKCRRELYQILEQNRVLIEVICQLQGGKIFLDASKDPMRLRHILSAGHWEVKVIGMIRDGRGETNSYMRHYNVPMEVAARAWMEKQREIDVMERRLGPGIYKRIKYEDLCRNPQGIIIQLYEFVGIEPSVTGSEFRSIEQHILGNEMRLKSTREIKLDEKWKSALSRKDLELFENIAGESNRNLGYE
jgi:hypothetical protein